MKKYRIIAHKSGIRTPLTVGYAGASSREDVLNLAQAMRETLGYPVNIGLDDTIDIGDIKRLDAILRRENREAYREMEMNIRNAIMEYPTQDWCDGCCDCEDDCEDDCDDYYDEDEDEDILDIETIRSVLNYILSSLN